MLTWIVAIPRKYCGEKIRKLLLAFEFALTLYFVHDKLICCWYSPEVIFNFEVILFRGAVFPCAESVQAELQAAADWNSTAEQSRGTVSSSQLSLLGEVQVTSHLLLLWKISSLNIPLWWPKKDWIWKTVWKTVAKMEVLIISQLREGWGVGSIFVWGHISV